MQESNIQQQYKSGTIKCTYVVLYDADDRPLFSLQAAAFGKDTPVGTSDLPASRHVPIRISDQVVEVLATYVHKIAHTDQGMTPALRALQDRFKLDLRRNQITCTNRTFYVLPSALNWSSTGASIKPDSDELPDPEPAPKSNKTKWALIAAAALAFLN